MMPPSARGRPTDLPSAARALTRLLADTRALGVERVGIDDADGRVLGEDIEAREPIPRTTHSTRDGYAVCTAAMQGSGPWTLSVEGEARAGHAAPRLEKGTACRISTGGPLPEGADAVVMHEQVESRRDAVVVTTKPPVGLHVRAAGADVATGSKPLLRGARLTPGRLGLAAALGREMLVVTRRPIVAVVATGDELRAPTAVASAGSVRESTSFAACAWLRRAGALPRLLLPLVDDREATVEGLAVAARGADVVVTIGGVGGGDHDHVRPALETLGASFDVTGVAVSPGRPFSAARLGEVRVACLPGTPAAALLTCVLFVLPLVRALQGDASPVAKRSPLRVVGSHVKHTPHEELLRARLEPHDEELCAVLVPNQTSATVSGFAEAQALVFVEPARTAVGHGDRLPVMLLADV